MSLHKCFSWLVFGMLLTQLGIAAFYCISVAYRVSQIMQKQEHIMALMAAAAAKPVSGPRTGSP